VTKRSVKSERAKTGLAEPGPDLESGAGTLPQQQEAIRARCFHPQGTFVEFPREDIESSIAARFEKIAAMYPNRIAVKSTDDALTYDELNRLANRIAHTILRRGPGGSASIALLFNQNSLMIAASLAALKIGRVFVPVDCAMPRDKLRQILSHVEQELILTEGEHVELARDLAGSSTVLNVATRETGVSDENPKIPIDSGSYAYVFFTSGSTGTPKGVITTHRNELHNIYKNTQILHISPDDRVSLLRSHNVGAARDLFLALLNGATLCSLDLKRHDLRGIAGWLIDEGITVFTCVTTIYRQALQNAHTSMHFPDIRLVHVGGEPVTRDDVELYKKYFSDPCLFVVRYSISETPAVSYYFIDKHTPVAEGQVPVGYPMRGNEIIILDDEGNPLPPNEVGEIAIKSPFLAPGYWRQPELTKAKFLADGTGGDARTYLTGDLGYLKPDGCLIHLGRKDFLVKVRGFRVETGEVESALRGLDKVKDVAVIASLDTNAETQLTAYVVPKDQFLLTPTALRRLLREKLPDYMIPQIFVLVNALPLTANGKIDRKALPDPGNARPQIETDYVAPRTEMEKRLAQIWAEVLDLSTVGVEDDFVELGGHSLLATRIIGKVHEAFGVEVSMRAFLDAATVVGLAALVTSSIKSTAEPRTRVVAIEETGEL
jgi:amino acid adenylation domain-containing protein